MIKLIFSRSQNGIIGVKGDLPWNLPEDLVIFKKKTKDHIVVMGSSTWHSLPVPFRPLTDRINVVLTHNPKSIEGPVQPQVKCFTTDDSSAALKEVLDTIQPLYPEKDIWIIGGRSVFEQALPLADEIHETVIKDDYEGDKSVFDPSDLKGFVNSPGEDATPSWVFSAKEGLTYRINVWRRIAGFENHGSCKPWDNPQ